MSFNGEDWPSGMSVRYWTGVRDGEGKIGSIRFDGVYMVGGVPCVYINGVGAVGLTHVERVPHEA